MLKPNQKQYLKAMAHTLKPVVIIGENGATASVLNEIALALEHHELIKIRVNGEDRLHRNTLIHTVIQASAAELIQCIGHVAILFRRNTKKPRITFP